MITHYIICNILTTVLYIYDYLVIMPLVSLFTRVPKIEKSFIFALSIILILMV